MSIAANAAEVRQSARHAAAGLTVAGAIGGRLSADIHPTPGVGSQQVTVVGAGQVQGSPDTLTADVEHRVHRARRHRRDEPDQQSPAGGDQRARRSRASTARTSAPPQVTLQPQYSASGAAGTPPSPVTAPPMRSTVKIHPTDAASRMLAVIVSTGGDATRISSVSYSIDARLAAGEGRAGAGVQRRQGPGRAVRPAVRPAAGQGAFHFRGIRRCARAGGPPAPPRGVSAIAAGTRPADRELLGDRGVGAGLVSCAINKLTNCRLSCGEKGQAGSGVGVDRRRARDVAAVGSTQVVISGVGTAVPDRVGLRGRQIQQRGSCRGGGVAADGGDLAAAVFGVSPRWTD